MKHTAILIDDEILALQRLERLLEPHKDFIEIIETAKNGIEAVEKINTFNPDLIFLDIQMPELDGFDVLKKTNHLPLIIFTTAYDEYALKAFETNSIDYLLKPIDPKRLKKAIEKLNNLSTKGKEFLREEISNLIKDVKKNQTKKMRITIGDKTRFLNIDEIYFIKTIEKHIEIHTYEKKYILSKSLNQIDKELSNEDFIRVHRSVIINMNYIDEAIRWFSGTYKVRMKDKNNTELPVSRRQKFKLGLS